VTNKRRPGEVRDAILTVLSVKTDGATVVEIAERVGGLIGQPAPSSIRSYLRLNTPSLFVRTARGRYALKEGVRSLHRDSDMRSRGEWPSFSFGRATLVNADSFEWLERQPENSIHAVVTDPPYGLVEYSEGEQEKLRNGRGGIWRIPPSFDGSKRSPIPRFTVLSSRDLDALEQFFYELGRALVPILVPGGNVVVASNPLLSHVVARGLARGGLERRGEIVRLVMTMRGGDRPKAAHEEFADVSVMPRSMWEPWVLFRKPVEGRVQDNLRKWKAGGFRRPSEGWPFGDVIASAPTHKTERALAPHPSLKPQTFLRTLVRGVLPLGEGVVLDPFAGSGSTLAAAEAVGYQSIGIEKDERYFDLGRKAISKLVAFKNGANYELNL